MDSSSVAGDLLSRIEAKRARVGIVGLGYVGLPMALESSRSGFETVGFDVDRNLVQRINKGESHIGDVPASELSSQVEKGLLTASAEMSELAGCDAISICVPTPLNKIKDPDLSYVIGAAKEIRSVLRPGQLIVLESTTFPGTTREVMLDLFEETKLEVGRDYFVCYSPERVDPGNKEWGIRNTPKVIGGITESCLKVGSALYERIFETLVPVSSPEAAELTKVYENTFRMINIALANELAQACDKLEVDVWEVIEAAATKPFGFMKFHPGPGLGGHCIPLDPHYLSWKMRTLAYKTRMIELASEINSEMPHFVVRKITDALNRESKSISGSEILILGVSYKKDIDDVRESPAVEIIDALRGSGGRVSFHDPYCSHLRLEGSGTADVLESEALTAETLSKTDAVVIVTDHSTVDYQLLLDNAGLIVDTRGVTRGLSGRGRVVQLAGAWSSARRNEGREVAVR